MPVTLGTFLEISLQFGNGHSATVLVAWRDSILLAPGSGSLHSVSKVTHHKKIDISEKWIENMDSFLEEKPVDFDRYAIADTRVALEFYLKTILQFEQLTGVLKAPLTLGDAAVKTYVKWCEDNGLTTNDIIGRELVQIAGKFGKLKTTLQHKPVRSFSEVMAALAYMGGMNIAFESGINREPGYIILDVDFSGAYAAAMAVVARIDWDTPSKSVSLNEIKQLYRKQKALPGAVPTVFCHLKFAFPENSRHACLPVPSPYGLLYPRTGITTCTGPEVALAIEMGAEIELLTSQRFFPVWNSEMKPMLAFAEFLSVTGL
ncbi:MAG: hypothetical protein IPJ50_14600 [Betaproteobacteria bacterium]|nr:hypothetical protein [Betaproteobacteria bacterium]